MVGKSNMGDYGLPLWIKMITGGVAGCISEIATIPLDTAKVRLQIQGQTLKAGEIPRYKGMFNTAFVMIKEEGLFSLYRGVYAGLQRQIVYASLRTGLYEPIRNFICGKDFVGEIPLYKRIIAGLSSGAIGILVANPTDVIKIRLQAEGNLAKGMPRRYNGVMDAWIKIYQNEGLKAYWTGAGPNVVRNAVINAAELATYDDAKERVIKWKLMNDNIWCHFVCSAWAGFVATVVGSPVDVMKTRIMNAKKGAGVQYKNVFDCFIQTFKNEGPLAFYNGFTANANRIISFNIVFFVSLQQIRRLTYEKVYKKE